MLADIWAFVRAVVSRWRGGMCSTFGLIFTVLGLWVPSEWAKVAFFIVAAACLFSAFFFAWRNEYRRGNQLQSRLDDRASRQAIQDQLGIFLAQGQDLLQKCTDKGLGQVRDAIVAWEESTNSFVGEN
jgi:hypothetical protein